MNKLIIGKTDLLTLSPELCREWSPKNSKNPSEYANQSNQKVWWVCGEGHEWEAVVGNRSTQGHRCPYCTGRKVLAGFNDLATLRPDLASQWSPNNTKTPSEVSPGSGVRVYWTCSQGHEWSVSPNQRTARSETRGCPYCSGRLAIKGVSDLETLYPNLKKEWSSRNTKHMSEYSGQSGKRVWWVCLDNGHEWYATISNRTLNNAGCAICAGRSILIGFNDLKTVSPEVASEWHPDNILTPGEVTISSHYHVKWLCSKNHTWMARVYDRKLYGCPYCANSISNPEVEVYDHVKTILLDAKVLSNDRKLIYPFELDIYIPSKNIAVEFNGLYWHSEVYKDKNYHYDKWRACADVGVQLITVWEDDWRDRPEVVKAMLAHKLGVSVEEKVGGRKCGVVEIGYAESSEFLEGNHIQGKASGSRYIGLEYSGGIVAVAVFLKTKSSMLLSRYASSCTVQGGLSKVMKYVDYPVVETFADLCVSDGGLYEQTGWEKVGFIEPDYRYVYKNNREHKFNFRLKRFRNDPSLKFEGGMTERQLAELNGISRIYDCGKVKYVWEGDNNE